MINKNGKWHSTDKWEFIENDESLISIRNLTTNNKVITVEVDSEKITEKARPLKLISNQRKKHFSIFQSFAREKV